MLRSFTRVTQRGFSTNLRRLSAMAHTSFPTDLPKPVDDGACNHLNGMSMPSVALPPTSSPEQRVDVSKLDGLAVIFCYPRTGAPNEKIPADWDAIPGARGCTPHACSFRDNLPELKQQGVKHIFGISTQDTLYQQEVHGRLHLPYDLLSDEKLEFQKALRLPYFEWNGKKLIKRLAIAARDGKIVKYWYPVFPPDSNANEVLKWLKGEK